MSADAQSSNPKDRFFIVGDFTTPENTSLFFQQVQYALSAGMVDEAINAVKNALSRSPHYVVGYSLLAQLAIATKNKDLARWTLDLAKNQIELHEDVYLQLASVSIGFGDIALAQECLSEGGRANPDSHNIFRQLGVLYLAEQKFDRAAIAFNRATKLNSRDVDAHLGLARIGLATKNIDIAQKALLSVKDYNPWHADFLPLSKELVAMTPNSRDAWFCLGVAHSYTSSAEHFDYEKAEEAFQKAIEIGPDSAALFFSYGDVLGFQSRWDEVMPNYIRSREMVREESKRLGLDKLGIHILGPDFTRCFGHEVMIDNFLKVKELGWLTPGRTLIMPGEHPVNAHLLKYYEPYADVLSPEASKLFEPMRPYVEHKIECIRLADGRYFHYDHLLGLAQRHWEDQKRPPLLKLTSEDRDRGWNLLEKLGIPRGSWFVAVHVRETKLGPDGEWLPCGENRNAHIETYFDSMKWIVDNGGWVIRTGNPSMKKLPPLHHVIDYANCDFREDWIDIFLLAECEFFLGSPSGPCFVPYVFGKRAAHANHHSVEFLPPSSKDTFILKLVWSEVEKRLLKFSEVMADWHSRYTEVDILKQVGLKLVDNSAEEVIELTQEMFRRVRGLEVDSPEDEQLQAEFRQSVGANECTGGARIGKAFIRKYRHLLGPAS